MTVEPIFKLNLHQTFLQGIVNWSFPWFNWNKSLRTKEERSSYHAQDYSESREVDVLLSEATTNTWISNYEESGIFGNIEM